MSDEKPQFLKCVIHESKKAYKTWAMCLVSLIVVLFVMGIFINYKDNMIGSLELIWGSIYAIFSSIPWYVYVISAALTIPIIYSTIKCVLRINYKYAIYITVASLILGFILIAAGVVYTNALAFIFGFSIITFGCSIPVIYGDV